MNDKMRAAKTKEHLKFSA